MRFAPYTSGRLKELKVGISNYSENKNSLDIIGNLTSTKIGIGTTNPTSQLHVVGDTLVTGISTFKNNSIIEGSLTVGSDVAITGGAPTDEGNLAVYGSGRNSLIIQTNDNSLDRGISFRNNGDSYTAYMSAVDVGNNFTDLAFGLGKGSLSSLGERMRITQEGNVGIGTKVPTDQVGASNTSILAVGIVTAYKLYSTVFGEFTGGSVLADTIVGTALSISGISTIGDANARTLNVAGVSTFAGTSTFNGLIDATANIQIRNNAPILKFAETDNSKNFFIVGDSNSLSVRMDATGGSNIIQKWNSNGTHSFYNNVIFVNDIDVDGQTDLDDLAVSGVSTFTGNINANGNIVGDNSTNISGINSVTATTFFGNLTGNADTATTATVTTNISTIDESSDNENFVVFTNSATGNQIPRTGSNLTFNASNGQLNATTFVGNLTGTVNTSAQPNITSLGTLSSLNVSGNVSIGGTLTYEDVTNVDSIGIITARKDVHVGAGLSVVGVSTFSEDIFIGVGASVGIGTDLIEAPLHVAGANSRGIVALFGAKDFVDSANYNYDDATIGLQGENPAGTYQGSGVQYITRNIGLTNWNHGYTTFDRVGDFHIGLGGLGNTKAIDRVTILAGGDVGIGTTVPNATLEVNGPIKTNAGSYTSPHPSGDTIGSGAALVIPSGSGIYVEHADAGVGKHTRNLIRENTGRIEIGRAGTGFITEVRVLPGTSGFFSVYNNASEAFRVDGDGNVGIGTQVPTDQVGASNTSILAVGILTASRIYSTVFGEFTGGTVTGDAIVGTALSISGISTIGDANARTINVSGISTFASNVKVLNGHLEIASATPEILFEDTTNNPDYKIRKQAGHFMIMDDTQTNDTEWRLSIRNGGTVDIPGNLDTHGDLDVDGHTELDQLNVSGISTFVGITSFKDDVTFVTSDGKNIFFDKSTDRMRFGTGVRLVMGDGTGGDDLNIFHNQINTIIGQNTVPLIFDTDNTIFGSQSGDRQIEIKDGGSVDLYHNNNLRLSTVGYGLSITGITSTTHLNVTGDVIVGGAITATSFSGDGSNLTNLPSSGIGTNGNVNTTGIITAAQFHGDGSNLTGVGNTSNVSTSTLNVTGVSTFRDNSIIEGSLTVGDSTSITGGAPTDQGNLAVYGNGRNSLIIQAGNNNQDRGMAFRNNGDFYVAYISAINMGSSNADLSFGSGIGAADVGNVTERIRIKHDTGNVGIGSAIPTAKLDVAGSLNVTGVSTFAGVINSTVSTGTAPFVVASTTLVTNLNADLLDGKSTANSKVGNSVVTRNAAGGFSAGDVTFDNIVGVAATFSGNVSVGGTLTYEDVTNIDSVGLITARTGIRVTGGVIEAQAGENKIPSLYADLAALPNASTYHGMFAHVHSTARGYFAHAGNWFELVNKEADGTVGTGTERYNIGPVDLTTLDVSGISTFNKPIDITAGAFSNNVSVGGRSITANIDILSTSLRGGVVVRNGYDYRTDTIDSAGFQVLDPYDSSSTSFAFRAAEGATLVDNFWVKADGTAFFRDNVGIGSDSTGGARLRVYKDGTNTILQQWRGSLGSTAGERAFNLYSPATDSNSDYFRFQTGNAIKFNIDNIDALCIDDGGKVGIGTDDPSNKLEVYVDSASNAGIMQLTQDGTGDAAIDFQIKGIQEYTLGIDNSVDARFKLSGSAELGSNDLVTVKYTGEVGIGTDNPVAKLDVNGSLNVTGVSTFSEGLFIPDTKKIALGNAAGNADLEIVHDTNNSVIRDKGTGSLVLSASEINFSRYGTADYYARFIGGGKVDLRYNGDIKFETTGYGVTVYGTTETQTLNVSGVSTFTGNIDANGDLDVDGHTNLDNVSIVGVTTTTGNLNVTDGRILIAQTAAPQLRINSSAADSSATRFVFGLATGTNQFINGAVSNDACITAPQEIKFGIGNNLRFRITDSLVISPQDIVPSGNNVKSLGNSSYRWSDLFAVDADISENLIVAGVSTFTGNINANGNIVGDNSTAITGIANVTGQNANSLNLLNVGYIGNTTTIPSTSFLHFNDQNVPAFGSGGNFTTLASVSGLNLIFDSNNNDNNGLVIGSGSTNTSLMTTHMVVSHVGNVGIGSTIPIGKLDVDGHTELDNLNVSGITTFGGNATFSANGNLTTTEGITIENSQPGIIFNDTGANPDFIIQNRDGSFAIRDTTSNANRFLVNMANGDVTVTGDIGVSGDIDVAGIGTIGSGASGQAFLQYQGSTKLNTASWGVQLNGTLQVSDGDPIFTKTNSSSTSNTLRLRTNAGDRLTIQHLNDESYITSQVGNINLNAPTVSISTNFTVAGVSTFTGDASFIGNVSIGGTLTYEDVTNIDSVGLITARSGIRVNNGGANIVGVTTLGSGSSGQAILQYQGVNKLTTISSGVYVTGGLNVSSTMHIPDGSIGLQIGNTNDLKLYHDGNNSYIDESGTGNLYIKSNSGIELYHNGSKKFETTSSGAIVTGILTATSFSGSGANLTNLPGISTSSDPSFSQVEWDVVNNGASAYRFTGPGNDGAEDNPDLYLVRGQKYTFNVNASGHPFKIRVSNGGSDYSDGVINNGAQSGKVIINVQHDAPAQLVYQCQYHGGMVGNIYIVGQHLANGADNRVITATSAYGFNGESNLTFNGSTLTVTGTVAATSYTGDGSSLTGITTTGDIIDVTGITTTSGTFNVSAGVSTNIDSFAYASADYKTAEYTLHFMNGSNIQAQKLLVMRNGTTAFSQEYGVMSSSDLLVSVGATVSSGNVLIQATPETGVSGVTTYRWRREVQL